MKTEKILKEILKECSIKEFKIDLNEKGGIPNSFDFNKLKNFMSFTKFGDEDTPVCKIIVDFKNVSPEIFEDVFDEVYVNELIGLDDFKGNIKIMNPNARHEGDYSKETYHPKIVNVEKNKNTKLITALIEYNI